MLTKDQAESASQAVLADGRLKQRAVSHKIATRYRPISVVLRFVVLAATGILVGGILGAKQAGAFFPWCLVGLVGGIAYAFVIGQVRHKHEA